MACERASYEIPVEVVLVRVLAEQQLLPAADRSGEFAHRRDGG